MSGAVKAILKQFCQAAAASDPKLKIFCALVDERPEEVTDFKVTLKGTTAEVMASNNDQPQAWQMACPIADGGSIVFISPDMRHIVRLDQFPAPDLPDGRWSEAIVMGSINARKEALDPENVAAFNKLLDASDPSAGSGPSI